MSAKQPQLAPNRRADGSIDHSYIKPEASPAPPPTVDADHLIYEWAVQLATEVKGHVYGKTVRPHEIVDDFLKTHPIPTGSNLSQ